MNGNGQVVVAGLFLLMTMVVAMVAVEMFEVPTFEPEAKPIQLLEIEANEAFFTRAPIELILQYTGGTNYNLKPEQIYYGVTTQDFAQAQATSATQIHTHNGVCSGLY